MSELSDIAAALKNIATALNNQNAIQEYWAQIGAAGGERANKNDPHIRQLEQILKDKDLEEIITAHNKAVNGTLDVQLRLLTPNIVNLDLSPYPFVTPDESLDFLPTPNIVTATAVI